MTREQAILNMHLCQTFLAMYHKQSYITCDVEPNAVRLHYFSLNQTKEEVEKTAKELDPLRLAESDLEFQSNEKLDVVTFNIYWSLWK